MKKSTETMQYINNDKLVHKSSNFMGQSVHDGSTCPLKTIGFYDFVKCEVTTYKMPVFREVALAHRVLNINFSTWSKVGRNIWSLQKLYRSKHIPSLAKNYLLWGFMGPIFDGPILMVHRAWTLILKTMKMARRNQHLKNIWFLVQL